MIRCKKVSWSFIFAIIALVTYGSTDFCGGLAGDDMSNVRHNRPAYNDRIIKKWYALKLYKALTSKETVDTDLLSNQVRSVVQSGANINAVDDNGVPLLCSVLDIRNQVAVWFKEDQQHEESDFYIFYERSEELSRQLLSAGVDVNKAESHANNTPLHVALENILPWSEIENLLEHGARINQINIFGATPLQYFFDCNERIEKDDSEEIYHVVSELLSKGADPFIKDYQGWSTADIIKRNGTKRLKALIKYYEQKKSKDSSDNGSSNTIRR